MNIKLIAPFVLAAAVLTGCDNKPAPTNQPNPQGETSANSTVEILYSSPAETDMLSVGQAVKLNVEVGYELEEPTGSLMLYVQRAEAGQAPLLTEQRIVAQGTGQVEFSVEFVVPDTDKISIYTPLAAAGTAQTKVVDFISIDVAR